jgi:thiol-disulfide isomerase/thioredoxin
LAAALIFTASCSEAPEQAAQTRPETTQQETKKASSVETLGQAEIIKAINDSAGKVVVVNFWATWCDPCREEIKDLKELREEYAEDQLVIMGIAVDNEPGAVEAFARRVDFNYPVFLATEAAARFFRIEAIPRLMLYDKKGELKVNAEGLANPDRLREIVDNLLSE